MMRKVLLVCLVLVSVAAAAKLKWNQLDASYKFDTYLQHYNKKYDNTNEYQMRKSIFENNLHKIINHNNDNTKTWKEEINHLADLTEEELKAKKGYNHRMALNAKKGRKAISLSSLSSLSVADLPTSVDWRTQGVVSPVKDQGNCGSCWSFAASETIESHHAIKTGQLWTLSEQQILDCTSNPQHCGGTGGCEGGTVEVAYTSIIKAGGLSSEWTYPYLSHPGNDFPKCNLLSNFSKTAPVTINGYTVLPENEYLPLLTAVATEGPIAISVDASSWHFYATGVFNGCNQTNPDIDHAVQLVGYGTDPKLGDYWLVRNSWTPAWGENGYIRVYRTSELQCGTDATPADGDGCDGGPEQVTVCGTCGILYDTVYPTL